MTDPEIATPQDQTPAAKTTFWSAFSQANITTGLAVFAVILAAAPYVVPQLQAFQVQKGLMSKPAMLEAAVNKLNDQKRAEEQMATAEQVKKAEARLKSRPSSWAYDPNDPVIGNPKAPIRVVEFLDYNCGVCRSIAPSLRSYLAENPDVSITVKEFPVITPISPLLSAYALAANETGNYEKVHDAFMKARFEDEADVLAVLTDLGLDAKALQKRAHADDILARINASTSLGHDLDLQGTPAFIINGTLIPSANLNALKASVAAARLKG